MRRINSIVAATALLGVSGAAYAQGTPGKLDLTPYNIAIRAGAALPFDTGLSNYGNPLIDLGVEYQFPNSLLPNGETYISADYFAKNLSFADGVWPICINQRFVMNRNVHDGRRTYFFLGLGGSIVAIGHSNFVATARGGVGADLGDAIFFEIAGTVGDRGETARPDAVSFCLGYRF